MYPGHYYELVECLESCRVRIIVLVHSICQTKKKRGTVDEYIRVSKFWRRRDIALLNNKFEFQEESSEEANDSDSERRHTDCEDNDHKSGTLFLSYIDWEQRGRGEDAEDLNVKDVKDVIEECRIEWPDGGDFDDSEFPTYPVAWAFWNGGEKDHTFFRRLPTIGPEENSTYYPKEKPDVVDLCCGMGGFSRGFSDAGFEIIAGVDKDPFAMNTFMVLPVNPHLTQLLGSILVQYSVRGRCQ
jgi:hypothetical protein